MIGQNEHRNIKVSGREMDNVINKNGKGKMALTNERLFGYLQERKPSLWSELSAFTSISLQNLAEPIHMPCSDPSFPVIWSYIPLCFRKYLASGFSMKHNPNTWFDYFQYLRIKILAFILVLFIQCHLILKDSPLFVSVKMYGCYWSLTANVLGQKLIAWFFW